MSKVALKRVTLCCIDTDHPAAGLRAIQKCMAQCRFDGALFFASQPMSEPGVDCHLIPRFESLRYLSLFMLKQVAPHLKTDFLLNIQWDGYVTHPSAWREDFLQYDYIGATWPWHRDGMRVGNGGFSLRSRRLLEIVAQPWFQLPPHLGEDESICRAHRAVLENKFGIRFAPEEVAERFSYERSVPRSATFGFHGMFNFWREVPDAELIQIVQMMPIDAFKSVHCAQLAAAYYRLQRWPPLRVLYGAWRARCSFDEVREVFVRGVAPQFIQPCLETCEALLRNSGV